MRLVSFLLAVTFVAASYGSRPAAAAPPPGYTDELVAAIPSPTALAFTPDGRIVVTTQGGTLRVVTAAGQLLGTPAFTFPASQICTNSERGLLGVAVDPQFATNHAIYLFYTNKHSPACPQNNGNADIDSTYPVNRVSRFTLPDTNVISAGSEVVLLDGIPSPNGNHNAGDLQFGPDGNVYIAVGDGGCYYLASGGCAGGNTAARELHHVLGKILRIRPDGTIPDGNPYTGAGTSRCNVTGFALNPQTKCQETWASGLRNPFRIAFDRFAPEAILYANDVGQGDWEEVDVITAGADYGWNVREGHCATGSTTNCGPPPQGMTNPILDYPSTSCNTITGGAVVPAGSFPGMARTYLFADFGCGTIFAKPAGSNSFTTWASGFGSSSITAMAFGPREGRQALYYLSYANGGVLRVIEGPPPEDADCDGQVNIQDAFAVLRAMAGLQGPPLPGNGCTGDADGSGGPTPNDVALILAAVTA